MEKIKSELLINILRKNRTSLNELFATERYINSTINSDSFLNELVKLLEPFILKHHATDYALLEKSTLRLYEKILTLCSRNLLGEGAKYPFFEDAFCKIFMHFSAYALDAPDDFVPALANAVYNLGREAPAGLRSWISLMQQFTAAELTYKEFKQIGFVAAWRCGMAHYRKEALEICKGLALAKFFRLFQLRTDGMNEEKKYEIIKVLGLNRWLTPESSQEMRSASIPPLVKIVSGFRGFGGDFIKPPHIYYQREHFIATDGISRFIVFADGFGQILKPYEEAISPDEIHEPWFRLNDKYQVLYKGTVFDLPLHLRIPINSFAFDKHTLIFTSPLSHSLFILGWGEWPE